MNNMLFSLLYLIDAILDPCTVFIYFYRFIFGYLKISLCAFSEVVHDTDDFVIECFW
jgi:hypothetical protein